MCLHAFFPVIGTLPRCTLKGLQRRWSAGGMEGVACVGVCHPHIWESNLDVQVATHHENEVDLHYTKLSTILQLALQHMEPHVHQNEPTSFKYKFPRQSSCLLPPQKLEANQRAPFHHTQHEIFHRTTSCLPWMFSHVCTSALPNDATPFGSCLAVSTNTETLEPTRESHLTTRTWKPPMDHPAAFPGSPYMCTCP